MSQHDFDADRARRELYEVMNTEDDFQTKASDALELGRTYLGVANGHLTEIDESTDYRKVVASSDPPDGVITPGLVMDLQLTFCRDAIKQDDPLTIHDTAAMGYDDHPASEVYGVKCYHGSTIHVGEDLYGTVCFGSTRPRTDPFSEEETLYAELIGRMLEHELNRQRTEAELERLDRFASVVSHDLRNPMTVAQSRIELERMERDSDNLAEAERALDRMDDIISDVLTVARQGREVEDTETLTLSSVVESCQGPIDVAEASVTVADDRTFKADPDRVRQLFENLFRNSVEHGSTSSEGRSPSGNRPQADDNRTESGDSVEHGSTSGQESTADDSGHVSVTVGTLDDGTGFYVADDGPGIPEDMHEEVFESGFTTHEDGTGLGLSIVSNIAEAHGWEVSVTDSVAGGARFEFSDVVSPP